MFISFRFLVNNVLNTILAGSNQTRLTGIPRYTVLASPIVVFARTPQHRLQRPSRPFSLLYPCRRLSSETQNLLSSRQPSSRVLSTCLYPLPYEPFALCALQCSLILFSYLAVSWFGQFPYTFCRSDFRLLWAPLGSTGLKSLSLSNISTLSSFGRTLVRIVSNDNFYIREFTYHWLDGIEWEEGEVGALTGTCEDTLRSALNRNCWLVTQTP